MGDERNAHDREGNAKGRAKDLLREEDGRSRDDHKETESSTHLNQPASQPGANIATLIDLLNFLAFRGHDFLVLNHDDHA